MSKEEVRMRNMLNEYNVTQAEIADEMGTHESNVTYLLRSLTPSKVQELEAIIIKLSNKEAPQKVAS